MQLEPFAPELDPDHDGSSLSYAQGEDCIPPKAVPALELVAVEVMAASSHGSLYGWTCSPGLPDDSDAAWIARRLVKIETPSAEEYAIVYDFLRLGDEQVRMTFERSEVTIFGERGFGSFGDPR